MPELNDMLTLDEFAKYMGLSKRVVLRKAKGRTPILQPLKLSKTEYRFCPRVVIACMAKRQGASAQDIAAMMGTTNANTNQLSTIKTDIHFHD